jgi:signal transduction histidine kinase
VIASISHELRTPLTSVVGYTELLLCGATGDLSADQRAMLERVATNGDRLLKLIEGLLCAAAQRPERHGAVDVADVVLQVVGELESLNGLRSAEGPLSASPTLAR